MKRIAWLLLSTLGCSATPAAPPPAPKPVATDKKAVAPKPSFKPGPALARRDDVKETIHGVTVLDPYRWLENPNSAESKQWLGAMDGYTR
ncbi:MAG TPA: hypothetical protein VFB62_04175, partial [Polyangiaceae bacterium]|nr:hypothetical protein [Polyangiaceae bacterium]